jgi:hypothetical protein
MFEPCAEIGRVAFQWLPRNVFSDVTRNYRCYLLHRARFCYDDLQELFSFTNSQWSGSRERRLLLSLSFRRRLVNYVNRFSFLRLKYPSSYPDFSTVPFCTTTVTRPVNFNWCSKLSVAALSSSNSCTLRRNSAKEQISDVQCFESMTTPKSAAVLFENSSLKQETVTRQLIYFF